MKIVEWINGIWHCPGPFHGTFNICDESVSLIQNHNNDFIVMRVTKVFDTDYATPINTIYYHSYDEAKAQYDRELKDDEELEWHVKQTVEFN